MLNSLGIGFVLRARDETREVIERLHGNLENLKKVGESSSMSITNAVGMSTKAIVGMGLAVSAAAVGAAFEFAEHADRMSLAISQAGAAAGATGVQLRELEEVARAKGMDSLYFSSIAAAESLRDLTKAGMDAGQAAQALDGTMGLLRITMGSLTSADAAAIINDSLKQFSMNASQAGELTDKLAFTMRNFGFQATDLRAAMAGLASGAALTGASLDDTLIGVGLIHRAFPNATRAAMALNMAMQQLAVPRAQKELRGIGVSVTDVHGKILPFVDIIQQLNDKTARMTDLQIASKLEMISGSRAAGGLTAVIEGLRTGITGANGEVMTGAAAIAYLRDQMAHTNGTANAMAGILGGTMHDAIEGLKNAFSNAGVAIGSGFEAPFMHAFQTANLFVRGLTQLFTQGGFTGEVRDAIDKRLGLKNILEGIFITVSRVRHLFGELGAAFDRSFAPFRPVLADLSSAFMSLGQALGIVGVSANDNAAHWDSFGAVGENVGNILAKLAGTVIPVLSDVLRVAAGAADLFRTPWETLSPIIRGVGQAIAGVIDVARNLLTGSWKGLWDGFVDVVVGASKAVIHLVLGLMGSIASALDSVGSAFGQDFGFKNSLTGIQAALNDQGALDRGTQVLKDLVPPSAPAIAANQNITQAIHVAAANGNAVPVGSPPIEVTVHAPVHLDGEKIATATAKAKRDRASRSFHPVPAAEGAY